MITYRLWYSSFMHPLSIIGQRQQALLRALLYKKTGLTVEELSQQLSISRNAVNQHLTALDANGYITSASLTYTGGRPSRVYILTDVGRELFPRHYSLLANLMVNWVKQNLGDDKLESCLSELGEQVAVQFKDRVDQHTSLTDAAAEVADIMKELGYEAASNDIAPDTVEIVANNCIFHKLAENTNKVCDLDITLMSTLLKSPVEHKECMVKGGQCCRFTIKKA